MDASLLMRLFGRDEAWKGPCTVIIAANATVQTVGHDSVASGGNRAYAPRVVSGRMPADSACLLRDGAALVLVQQFKVRQATGEDQTRQTMSLVATSQIAAIEFPDASALAAVGLPIPVIKSSGSHPGTTRYE